MIDMEDYFKRKRAELGMDREDVLVSMQRILEEWYPGLARAKSLNNELLTVVTVSAAVAGELRLRQVELQLRADGAGVVYKRLVIRIGSIRVD